MASNPRRAWRHGEPLRQQPDGDVRPPQLASETLHGIDDDARVVEAQGWQRVDRLPPRARLIRSQHSGIDQREVRDSRDPATRVTLRIGIGFQLLEVHGADPGLLGELALGGLLRTLARAHEAAGEHPCPRKRVLAALDQQDVQAARQRGKDDRHGIHPGGSRKPRGIDR